MLSRLVANGLAGVLAVAMLLFVAGCGGAGSQGGNEDEARTALTKALDAWKAGRTAADMRQESPEVVVGDSDWKQGRKLLAYEIGRGMFDGKNLRVPVTLTVAQPPRSNRKLVVNYIVGTKPVITIFRDSD
jgi:hypothetical protein